MFLLTINSCHLILQTQHGTVQVRLFGSGSRSTQFLQIKFPARFNPYRVNRSIPIVKNKKLNQKTTTTIDDNQINLRQPPPPPVSGNHPTGFNTITDS
ncbi:hypothetical protein QVD17_35530 [Tagetes erecta]|uniref:Uncharacterized protein n=1 Tax=Tagetes erecta TaxID=13708 RepID=A0AAD8JZN5_TARER|nr:hypothetical protein QVD17_35530 [Tagetes erecta]